MLSQLRQRLAQHTAVLGLPGGLAAFILLIGSLTLMSASDHRPALGLVGAGGLLLLVSMVLSIVISIRSTRLVLTAWALTVTSWLAVILFWNDSDQIANLLRSL